MARVGCLGDIVFEASDRLMRTLDGIQWKGSAKFGVHDRHGTDALTEFTGLSPDEISFTITLNAFLGTNPMLELEQLWEYERLGTPLPLVIGSHIYGKYRWTIQSHTASLEHYSRNGELVQCNVKLELLEYLKK